MKRNRLVVFSSVKHFESNGVVVAHAGFVKEINPLLTIFEKVLVVCTKSKPGLEKGDEIAYQFSNVEFHFFNLREYKGSVFNLKDYRGSKSALFKTVAYYFKAFLEGCKLVEPSDILMARGPDGIGFLPIIISKFKRTKLIGNYADQWIGHEDEPLSYRIQKYFYGSPFWFNGPVQIYGENDPRRPHLVPFFTSSVSKGQFQDMESKISKKENLGKIICVGRLEYDKGFDLLLQALNRVFSAFPQAGFKVMVIGDGKERVALESQSRELGLENHVVFPGWLSHDEVLVKLLEADLFIHPSRKEGFGKVLIEAMACGVPIIASDIGVSREILGKDYPFFFYRNDVERLKSHIEMFVHHPQKLKVVGQNLRNRLSEKGYFLENLAEQYENLLEKFNR